MMYKREVAIKIKNLKKKYRLGVIGGGTLQGDIQSWWARIRGKEDPNLQIGKKVGNRNETFFALEGIDLTVYKGERLGIIGHNGAGKSTMLKLLSRVTAPTEGRIQINGRISSMLEVGTGFNPELTGRENIYLNGAILGMQKSEVDEKINDIIDFSECGQFIDTPVKRYSSGMYVKLAFAVAAHLDSEILVMDEVLAVGDMKFQQKCLGKMSDVSQSEGRTVLYVSHNMKTIKQLCNRCIVLERGKIIYDGDVEKAIELYLGVDNIEYPIHYDYATLKRMDVIDTNIKKLTIESLSICGKKEAIFIQDKYIRLKINLAASQDMSDVCMRVEIISGDDSVVGTAFMESGVALKKGEIKTLVVDVDISMLVNGKYKTIMSFFAKNEYGTKEELDAVNPAFCFCVQKEMRYDWPARYWGNVEFPNIKYVGED